MEACLIDCINSSLKLYMYRNAAFLSERLYAEYPSESNLHLLATCYFRSNQAYRVYHVLKGTKSMQSRYLFALACFEMGNLAEAETALLPPGEPGTEVPNGAAGYYMLGLICRHTDRRQAAIAHYTLALSLDPFFWSAYEELCMLGAEEDAAALYGDLAVLHLQRQQLQWEFQSQHLSQGDNADSPSALQNSRSPHLNDGSPRHPKSMAIGDIATSVGTSTTLIGSGGHSPVAGGMSSYTTPSPCPPQLSSGPPALNRPIHGVFGGTTGGSGTSSYLSSQMGDVSPRALVNAPGQQQRRKIIDESKLKKSIRTPSSRAAYSQVSGRLFSEPVPRRSTRLSGEANVGSAQQNSATGISLGAASSFLGGNGSGHSSSSQLGMAGSTSRGIGATSLRSSISRKSVAGIETNIEEGRRNGDCFDDTGSDEGGVNLARRIATAGTEEEPQCRSRISSFSTVVPRGKRAMEGAMELLNLLRVIGEAFRHLCMYHCQEALQTFMKLSQQQYATGWVLCQVGKAYFEMVDYAEAERAFSWARRVSPFRLEGIDVYSTVLYHMKKEVELSYLAQEMVAMDRLSPQAWCVMGNCFSLQKDHKAALKYFQRALQLDQYFTYAHTLCSHEYRSAHL